jgi:hypothetical protein
LELMRRPTPHDVAYRWHTEMMLGWRGDPDAITEEAQCGWYKTRLVKGGPFVPARIYLEQHVDATTGELLQDEVMHCEIGGRAADVEEKWLHLAHEPITEDEFEYLTAVAMHAAWHDPSQPQAKPRKPVDFSTARAPKF